jgi:hypothetical protein
MMKRAIVLALALSLGAAGTISAASADTAGWRAKHPRRAEVNARLNNQNHRIGVERKQGDLTRAQAANLHAEDRGIRAQERFDAGQNGGHITRAQQAQLNHEENQTSGQIGR